MFVCFYLERKYHHMKAQIEICVKRYAVRGDRDAVFLSWSTFAEYTKPVRFYVGYRFTLAKYESETTLRG